MKEKILNLHKEGKSYREIQKILGCSKGTISYHLGTGQKEKTRQRARDKRGYITKYLQELKQHSPCVDCKENYPYWIMDFDHLGDKEFNLSNYRNHTSDLNKIKLEVAKCDIVCANCHRNRTFMRSNSANSNTMDISSLYAIE